MPPARVVARSSSTARAAGYVPDGLSAQEWESMKKKKEVEAAKKKDYYKNKKFEVSKEIKPSNVFPWHYLVQHQYERVV